MKTRHKFTYEKEECVDEMRVEGASSEEEIFSPIGVCAKTDIIDTTIDDPLRLVLKEEEITIDTGLTSSLTGTNKEYETTSGMRTMKK